jgi:hypothetical protein
MNPYFHSSTHLHGVNTIYFYFTDVVLIQPHFGVTAVTACVIYMFLTKNLYMKDAMYYYKKLGQENCFNR